MVFQTPLLSLALLALATLLHTTQVHAYIPAQPSNVTLQGIGRVKASTLHLQWYTNESAWEYVAPRSAVPKAGLGGAIQGIFVHFTEDCAGNETTTTPWIAFVSCDGLNSTNVSRETDIFIMAKDRGAKSAVLYSLHSETCVINPGYQNLALSVFATQTLNASWRIEHDFRQLGPSNSAHYEYFDAAMLNDAAVVLNDTTTLHYPVAPGFLFATLPTFNVGGAELRNDVNGTGASTSASGAGSQNTGVAMIVLYTITGCVSALFSGVIVSGAIRAIRYPERYGPRAADPTLGGGQSRAGGLGRAILDTFPIVKFGSPGNGRESTLSHSKDIESARIDTEPVAPEPLPNSMQLAQLSVTTEHDEHHHDPQEGTVTATTNQETREDSQPPEETDHINLSPQICTADHGALRGPTSPPEMDTRIPESIGRETCPICIVDFEEGDDLRVLPCEGKHQFHQSCVDPWLLELSGSCPICRQDFHALETIISGEQGSVASPINRYSEGSTFVIQNRFSRYLRFALGRRGGLAGRDQVSPLPPES